MRSFYKKIFFTLLLFVSLFQVNAEQTGQAAAARQLLLVDSSWLLQHRHEADIVVLDARSPEEYQRGHITGAINLPATRTYQDDLKSRVVPQQAIEEMLGSLGVDNDSHVIIYGNARYMDAARVFWTLDLYSHRHVSVLNGAFTGWQAAGLPVDTRQPLITPAKYRAAINPGKMATRLQALLAIGNPNVVLVDAREAVEFQGVESRATRSGHIPSAINIVKGENLESRKGIVYFKYVSALKKLYAMVNSYAKIILYCNSGSESAVSYLALRLLDRNVSVYDGAWLEWGNDPRLPVRSPAP